MTDSGSGSEPEQTSESSDIPDEEVDNAIEEILEEIEASDAALDQAEDTAEYVLELRLKEIRYTDGIDTNSNIDTSRLGAADVIAGGLSTFKYEAINTGDKRFPGGEAANVSVDAGSHETTYTGTQEIPEIQPGESELFSLNIGIQQEGALMLRFDIMAADGKIVNNPSGDTSPAYTQSIRGVPLQDVLILNTLENLLEEARDE